MAKFEDIKDRVVETRNIVREGKIHFEMTQAAKDREELARTVKSLLKLADEFESLTPFTDTKFSDGYHSGLRTAADAIRGIVEGELN